VEKAFSLSTFDSKFKERAAYEVEVDWVKRVLSRGLILKTDLIPGPETK
jgi:hypothetical protein